MLGAVISLNSDKLSDVLFPDDERCFLCLEDSPDLLVFPDNVRGLRLFVGEVRGVIFVSPGVMPELDSRSLRTPEVVLLVKKAGRAAFVVMTGLEGLYGGMDASSA